MITAPVRNGEASGGEEGRRRDRSEGGEGAAPSSPGRRRWLVPLLTAVVPVVLFFGTLAYLALGGERRPGCRHDHPASQVRGWWQKARTHDIELPGLRYLNYDGGVNCIRVGIDDPQAKIHLQRRFRRLHVPPEVILYERVEADGARDSGQRGGEGSSGGGSG